MIQPWGQLGFQVSTRYYPAAMKGEYYYYAIEVRVCLPTGTQQLYTHVDKDAQGQH